MSSISILFPFFKTPVVLSTETYEARTEGRSKGQLGENSRKRREQLTPQRNPSLKLFTSNFYGIQLEPLPPSISSLMLFASMVVHVLEGVILTLPVPPWALVANGGKLCVNRRRKRQELSRERESDE